MDVRLMLIAASALGLATGALAEPVVDQANVELAAEDRRQRLRVFRYPGDLVADLFDLPQIDTQHITFSLLAVVEILNIFISKKSRR